MFTMISNNFNFRFMDFLLYFVHENELHEYFEKYDKTTNTNSADDEIDLDYEDLTTVSPDSSDDSMEIFKVEVDKNKIRKTTSPSDKSIFEENDVCGVTLIFFYPTPIFKPIRNVLKWFVKVD